MCATSGWIVGGVATDTASTTTAGPSGGIGDPLRSVPPDEEFRPRPDAARDDGEPHPGHGSVGIQVRPGRPARAHHSSAHGLSGRVVRAFAHAAAWRSRAASEARMAWYISRSARPGPTPSSQSSISVAYR